MQPIYTPAKLCLMPTLDEIKSQINSLSSTEKFFGRREIKELPNVLWPDEKLENIIQGFYNGGNGILVATNKRLVFVDKKMIFGIRVEDFPYDRITNIKYETSLLYGKLTIYTAAKKAVIDQVTKSSVRSFGDWIRARISPATGNVLDRDSGQADSIAKLERLVKLKAEGILSEDEFIEQKRRILQ